MELKEYIHIIKKYSSLFFPIWAAVLLAAFGWYLLRPLAYDVSVSLEIARRSSEQTDAYQYDQYYRLQADDKFADSVTQWLKDPQIAQQIYKDSAVTLPAKSLRGLSGTFGAEKLASNYVQVHFQTARKDDGSKITRAMYEFLSQKTDKLNASAQSKDWFILIFNEPVILQHQTNLALVLAIAAVAGFLLGLFGVLLRHYWEE